MPAYQLLNALINLSGSRDNVAAREGAEAITLPEAIVLQAIHGGEEHVHSLVAIGTVERDAAAEFERLLNLYGDVVDKVFPRVAGLVNLPIANDAIPTSDEVAAAKAAADAAAAEVRAKKAPKPASTTTTKTKAASTPASTDGADGADTVAGGMPDLLASPSA